MLLKFGFDILPLVWKFFAFSTAVLALSMTKNNFVNVFYTYPSKILEILWDFASILLLQGYENNERVFSHSGNNLPETYISSVSLLHLTFTSDFSIVEPGFEVEISGTQ